MASVEFSSHLDQALASVTPIYGQFDMDPASHADQFPNALMDGVFVLYSEIRDQRESGVPHQLALAASGHAMIRNIQFTGPFGLSGDLNFIARYLPEAIDRHALHNLSRTIIAARDAK